MVDRFVVGIRSVLAGPSCTSSDPTPYMGKNGKFFKRCDRRRYSLRNRQALFVYGSLCRAELRYSLLQRHIEACPALLNDYAAYWLGSEPYPGLRRHIGEHTRGQLLRGLSTREMRVLDRYEGQRYRRTRCSVQLGHSRLHAWVYLIRPGYRRELSWRKMAEFL